MSARNWATFWFLVIVSLLSAISFWVVANHRDNENERMMIQLLIARGKSPVEARCAVRGFVNSTESLVCQAAVLRGGI